MDTWNDFYVDFYLALVWACTHCFHQLVHFLVVFQGIPQGLLCAQQPLPKPGHLCLCCRRVQHRISAVVWGWLLPTLASGNTWGHISACAREDDVRNEHSLTCTWHLDTCITHMHVFVFSPKFSLFVTHFLFFLSIFSVRTWKMQITWRIQVWKTRESCLTSSSSFSRRVLMSSCSFCSFILHSALCTSLLRSRSTPGEWRGDSSSSTRSSFRLLHARGQM